MSVPTEAQLIAFLNAAAVDQAIQDPAFRAQLLADPKAVVEKVLNTSLPPGFVLKAVEASPTEYTIVLPYQATTGADGELSDADLEAVAGGSKSGATSFFKGVVGAGSDGSDAGDFGAGVGGGMQGGKPSGDSYYGALGWGGGTAIRAGGKGRNPFGPGSF